MNELIIRACSNKLSSTKELFPNALNCAIAICAMDHNVDVGYRSKIWKNQMTSLQI